MRRTARSPEKRNTESRSVHDFKFLVGFVLYDFGWILIAHSRLEISALETVEIRGLAMRWLRSVDPRRKSTQALRTSGHPRVPVPINETQNRDFFAIRNSYWTFLSMTYVEF